eukprot:m.78099 g.78099  ORF g.78099 m.78099 type:complete len:664 (-) comp12656_c0_seq5:366-2357(-)
MADEDNLITLVTMTGMDVDLCEQVLREKDGNLAAALEVLMPASDMTAETIPELNEFTQASESPVTQSRPYGNGSSSSSYANSRISQNASPSTRPLQAFSNLGLNNSAATTQSHPRLSQNIGAVRPWEHLVEHEDMNLARGIALSNMRTQNLPAVSQQSRSGPGVPLGQEARDFLSDEDQDLARAIAQSLAEAGSSPPGPTVPSSRESIAHFEFKILYDGETYDISLDGTASIGELKEVIQAMTGVEENKQIITNWPTRIPQSNRESVASIVSDSSIPCELKLEKRVVTLRQSQSSMGSQALGDEDDSDMSVDEDDDSTFASPTPSPTRPSVTRQNGLVPNGNLQPAQFGISFAQRFGDNGPLFLPDTLATTLESALTMGRPVVIYLHSDRVVERNIYVTQVLQSETITNWLANNALVWGWDMTSSEGRDFICYMVNQISGRLYQEMRPANLELPSLVVLALAGSGTSLIDVIEGFHEVESVHEQLEMANAQAQSVISDYMQQKRQARERQQIRAEQDAAYEESRKADARKAEERLAAEARQKEEEEAARLEAERIESEKRASELAEQQRLEEISRNLPAEPTEDGPDVVTIQIRGPQGTRLTRKFLKSNKVQDILDFCLTKGMPISDSKLVIPRPRKVLSDHKSSTLGEVGLQKRELLILESA